MVKKTNQPDKEPLILETNQAELPQEAIRVGDISLASSEVSINELCGLVVALCEKQAVRDYLFNHRIQKTMDYIN